MSTRHGRNHPASVHARLRQLRPSGQDLNRILQQYVAERFLYRLGASPVADRFILKGASLFLVWNGDAFRGTGDIDLLAKGRTTQDAIRRALDVICAVPCTKDGIVFDTSRTRVRQLPVDDGHSTRFHLVGMLGNVRLPLQVDIGVGDTVNPPPKRSRYPTLLDHPQPMVWMYPRETLIAEKFAAMVSMAHHNSRIKDVWDIAALATDFFFDGPVLQRAVRATLLQREALRRTEVAALGPVYYEEPERQAMWSGFRSRVEVHGYQPNSLAEAGVVVRAFLRPVWSSILDEEPFEMEWSPGGPWRQRGSEPEGEGDG